MKNKRLILVSCCAAAALIASPAFGEMHKKSKGTSASKSQRTAVRTTQVTPKMGHATRQMTPMYSRNTRAPFSGTRQYAATRNYGGTRYAGTRYYGNSAYYGGTRYGTTGYYSGTPYYGGGYSNYGYSYWPYVAASAWPYVASSFSPYGSYGYNPYSYYSGYPNTYSYYQSGYGYN